MKNKKQKDLNSITKKVINEKMNKRITCWYCKNNGYNILDEFGCCKTCGTNLIKYPYRDSLKYPDMRNVENEILGHREPCEITQDD